MNYKTRAYVDGKEVSVTRFYEEYSKIGDLDQDMFSLLCSAFGGGSTFRGRDFVEEILDIDSIFRRNRAT